MNFQHIMTEGMLVPKELLQYYSCKLSLHQEQVKWEEQENKVGSPEHTEFNTSFSENSEDFTQPFSNYNFHVDSRPTFIATAMTVPLCLLYRESLEAKICLELHFVEPTCKSKLNLVLTKFMQEDIHLTLSYLYSTLSTKQEGEHTFILMWAAPILPCIFFQYIE